MTDLPGRRADRPARPDRPADRDAADRAPGQTVTARCEEVDGLRETHRLALSDRGYEHPHPPWTFRGARLRAGVVGRRDHAEVEDRVKGIKRIGLGLLPSKSWQANAAWVLAATIAADLDAWTRLLLLPDEPELAAAEPETIRTKLYHLPAPGTPPTPVGAPCTSTAPGPGQQRSPPPGSGSPASRPSPDRPATTPTTPESRAPHHPRARGTRRHRSVTRRPVPRRHGTYGAASRSRPRGQSLGRIEADAPRHQ